jgi:hypothetical protein
VVGAAPCVVSSLVEEGGRGPEKNDSSVSTWFPRGVVRELVGGATPEPLIETDVEGGRWEVVRGVAVKAGGAVEE